MPVQLGHAEVVTSASSTSGGDRAACRYSSATPRWSPAPAAPAAAIGRHAGAAWPRRGGHQRQHQQHRRRRSGGMPVQLGQAEMVTCTTAGDQARDW